MEREYPNWICSDCGVLHGRRVPNVATFHEDICGVCGEVTICTEPRDYGHLKDTWEDHPITKKISWDKELVEQFNEFTPELTHDPMDGVEPKSKRQWLSLIQIMNDDLSKHNDFEVNPASAFRMIPEVGELVDAILKHEGMKKIKKSDSIEDIEDEIRDGIGDVLVLLAQVASHYEIDMQEAYIDAYNEVCKRSYHD